MKYFFLISDTSGDFVVIDAIHIAQKWIEKQAKDLWKPIKGPDTIFLSRYEIHRDLYLLMLLKFSK